MPIPHPGGRVYTQAEDGNSRLASTTLASFLSPDVRPLSEINWQSLGSSSPKFVLPDARRKRCAIFGMALHSSRLNTYSPVQTSRVETKGKHLLLLLLLRGEQKLQRSCVRCFANEPLLKPLSFLILAGPSIRRPMKCGLKLIVA